LLHEDRHREREDLWTELRRIERKLDDLAGILAIVCGFAAGWEVYHLIQGILTENDLVAWLGAIFAFLAVMGWLQWKWIFKS
jgi:hypothetical protein